MELSPLKIPTDGAAQAALFFAELYPPSEAINIITDFRRDERDGHVTCSPRGAGDTRTAEHWAEFSGRNGVPSGDAGAWFRMNPVASVGSGSKGTYTDADIGSFNFLLVESDTLPLPVQLSVLARLALPIVSIVTSGGSSAHALVHVGAKDAEDYETAAFGIFRCLRVLGFDIVNSNPSRLSRLPGAIRKIDGAGDGEQRLLYLNRDAEGDPIIR